MFLFLFAHLRLFHFLFLNCNFFSVFLDAYKHASIHIQYFEPITLFAVNISLSFHGISMKFTGASISRLSFFSFIFFHFTLFTSRFTIKSSRFDCPFWVVWQIFGKIEHFRRLNIRCIIFIINTRKKKPNCPDLFLYMSETVLLWVLMDFCLSC